MGWTGMENDGVRRDARGHLNRVLGTESAQRVLACERVGDAIYAAYWEATDQVTGLVVLIDRHVQRGWTHYKLIDEGMGPHADECPESILNVLDPTDSEYANEWRVRCRQNLINDYRRRIAALEST